MHSSDHDNTGAVSIILMIRTTSPYSQHGDDMIFLYGKHGWFKKSGGISPAPFANKMVRKTFPYCKHGDGICFNRKPGRPLPSFLPALLPPGRGVEAQVSKNLPDWCTPQGISNMFC